MGDDLRHFPHTITKCQCVEVATVFIGKKLNLTSNQDYYNTAV